MHHPRRVVLGSAGDASSHVPARRAPASLELALPDSRLPTPRSEIVVEGAPVVDAAHAAKAAPRGSRAASAVRPRVVIGNDDRQRVFNFTEYPWCAICQLVIKAADGVTLMGTGWLAGPKLLVTAGHCVFMHARGGWVKSISVFAADAQGGAPLARAKTFRTVDGWATHGSLSADYGAVVLDTPLGATRGTFGYADATDSRLTQVDVNIAGYPDDKLPPGSLWWHSRRIQRAGKSALFYSVDTSGGQSGAPVWYQNDARRIAVGIHGNGSDRANMAVRITSEVFANIQLWNRETERL